MPRKSNDYRAAVWAVLQDGEWHSALELVQVGGLRFAARIHELRHEGGHRVLCRVVDSRSSYRWTCDCGPLPEDPGPEVPYCPRCRAVLEELAGPRAEPAPEPATEKPNTNHAEQLALFAIRGAA